ncbi:helix-turn-helix domain-containing protein [Myxococcota bacterium]|nr:helix-turn-helix domain-containing protein [Myxococcota bacterium]
MGSEIRGLPEQAPLICEPPEGTSVGGYLARQRRLRRISLDELAHRTKIPRRSLERLEAGAFDAEPDGFARGFVRSVALELGLDPEDAVMRLLAEPITEGRQRGGSGRYAGLASGRVSWLVVSALLVAGLLVGALTLLAPGTGDVTARKSEPDVLLRRDVVRDLAARAGRQALPEGPQSNSPGGP